MKIIIALATVAALLGLASASSGGPYGLCQYDSEKSPHRVNYDYSDIEEKEQRCLCSEIDLPGRKLVLVNLDDQCQIDRLLREGIFVHSGDLVIMAGSSNEYGALMDWEYYSSDQNVLLDLIQAINDIDPLTPGPIFDDDGYSHTFFDGNDYDIPD